MNPATRLKILLQPHRNSIRFVVLFILYFALGQSIYTVIEPYIKPVYVDILNTRVPCTIINILTPTQEATAHSNEIVAKQGSVIIGKGCDAIGAILLVMAGLGAFPMNFLKKVTGLLLALAILYLSNLVRILLMFYVYLYKPGFFHVMHVYISQIFIIAIGWLFFAYWIKTCKLQA